jgi:urease accessory protein UreH
VIARVLAPGSEEARALLFEAWNLLRRPLLDKPARALRKL